MEINRIGDFSLNWGESLCWDDLKRRLYFVDCATSQLFWLDNAETPLNSLTLSSMPSGCGLAEDGRLIMSLDDGLHLIDPDSHSDEMLTPYPEALGKRANDATLDAAGNFVTGTLNIGPGPGSYWWYSNNDGWRQLDDGITNANGPVILTGEGADCLVFADTPAQKLYAYNYNPLEGTVLDKRVFADISELNGFPDGACATNDNGVLSCVLGPGLIAYYTENGLQKTIDAGSEQPSDITFGGPDLDRLFVVSIKLDLGQGGGAPKSLLAGALVEIEGSELSGVKENRFRL